MTLNAYFRWQANKRWVATIKYSVLRYIYSMIAFVMCSFFSKEKPLEKADVLVLHRSQGFKKIPGLDQRLKDYKVVDTHVEKVKGMLSVDKLNAPKFNVPFEFFVYAAYASYLVCKYRPRVVIVTANGAIYTPFLRKAINAADGFLVHIPHSIPTSNYRKFCLCEYDYSFVYGRSSIDSMKAMPVSLGRCVCVCSGSIFIHKKNSVPKVHYEEDDFCVLLGSGPSFESGDMAASIYRDMISWSKSSVGIKVYFKPHPRSDLKLWNLLVKELKAENSTGIFTVMPDCKGAKFAVAAYTNAVVDVADMSIPVIWMADKCQPDLFRIEEYFLPRAVNLNQLFGRIEAMLSDLNYYQTQANLFREYHLSTIENPVEFISSAIKRLILGEGEIKGVSWHGMNQCD